MEQRSVALEVIQLAFIQVLDQLPLLHSLPPSVKADAAEELYRRLLAGYARPGMYDNCNWPHIATALKQLPLFSVLTTEAREQIAQHIELTIFPVINLIKSK